MDDGSNGTYKNGTSYSNAVLTVSGLSCFLSILGSVVIFVAYAVTPAIRKSFTWQLIVCLTVADFMTASGYTVSLIRYARKEEDDTIGFHLCHGQAFITTFSSLVSFFLTIAISIHVCSTTMYGSQGQDGQRPSSTKLLWYNVMSWVPPAIIVCVAEAYGMLGESIHVSGTGPWCWIDTNKPHSVLWQVLAGKGWEILCYLVTFGLFIVIKSYEYRLKKREERYGNVTNMSNEDRTFLYVWFVLFAIRIWGTIRFFSGVVDEDLTNDNTLMKIFLYMQAFGDPAQAFCNCILFCMLNSSVRGELAGHFRVTPKRYNRQKKATDLQVLTLEIL